MWPSCVHLECYQKQRKVCKHNQVFPLVCVVCLMDHTRFYQKILFHKCFKSTNAWWWHSHKIQLLKILHQGDRFSDALYQQHWFKQWRIDYKIGFQIELCEYIQICAQISVWAERPELCLVLETEPLVLRWGPAATVRDAVYIKLNENESRQGLWEIKFDYMARTGYRYPANT